MREMQIETTMKDLYTPTEMTKGKLKLTIPCGTTGFLIAAVGSKTWFSHFGKQFAVSHNVKHKVIMPAS